MDRVITLPLTALSSSGEAVGRLQDGLVAFVPGGAPGDLAEIELTERRKGYARGKLLQIVEPGETRRTPECVLAAEGRCGGCPLMHVSRAAQLAAKEDFVRRALRHTGAQVRPILSPAAALGYRIRARFILRGGKLGFQAARSHQVAEVATCPVLVPALDLALRAAGDAVRHVLGEEGTLAGVIGAGDEVHVSVDIGRGGDRQKAQAILWGLVTEGRIAGASIAGQHRGVRAVNVGGAAGPLLTSAAAFAQASDAGHDELLALVDEAVGSPAPGSRWPRLLELYAGSGNFTRLLGQRAAAVVAIETDPAAAARLRALGERIVVRREPAEQATASLVRAEERFEVAVLDPPRTGAAEVIPALAQLGLRRIIYVSCDPMTLGRDLVQLGRLGFAALHAQPIDLMPHTAHVETVAVAEPRPEIPR